MSTTYKDPNKSQQIREPLFRRFRSYYRGPRSSKTENLAANQIYIDIQRLYLELESININVLNKIKLILDKEKDDNFTKLEDDRIKKILY
jgi:hypothetical protein